MQAFEVGDLGLVAGFDERLKSRFHQRAYASAEHGLLAKQIGLRLFGKRGFEDPRARRAQRLGVGKRKGFGLPRSVLMDGEQRGCAAAFTVEFPHAMARRFRSNHGDVHLWRRCNRAVMDVEAVGKHQHLARAKVRRYTMLVDGGLAGIGREHHDNVGPGRRGRHSGHGEPGGFRFRPRGAGIAQTHAHSHSAVFQIQGVRVTLRAVADHRDLFRLNERQVRGRVVMNRCHLFLPN